MEQILLNKSKSKRAVNTGFNTQVDLKQTSRLLPYEGVIDKINLYSVFENERDNSSTYRLIFNINPVCSNVLFNTLTEVVKNEGSPNVVVLDNNGKTVNEAVNKNNVTRYQAIRNTEYSNEECNFIYHCGYDIFNNHLLRSNTFKSVNTLKNGNSEDYKNYNTLFDKLRDVDGKNLNFSFRCGSNIITSDLHLYKVDEVDSFFDSINRNLEEENGWFGFVNSMKMNTQTNKSDSELINKVINYKKPCEFVDMYPDRTLFSFVPKLNKFRKRLENNWNYCITYPFSSTKEHPLISEIGKNDGEYNGLKILMITNTTSYTGDKILLFNCACRHNLKRNDKFVIIKNNATMSMKIDKIFNVSNVGDVNENNKEYMFYIIIDSDVKELFNFDDSDNIIIDENDSYRLRRHVNGYDSEYYIRIFRKLPNFKYARQKPSDDEVKDVKYLNENTIPFDNSLSKLAFSNNIYSDNAAQIVFTDNIDIKYLTDNLGRPLTEIYLTIVKNNSGYKEWYENKDYGNEKVEFSHCFGQVTSGFDLPYDVKPDAGRFNYSEYSNVHYLTNLKSINSSKPLENNITISGSTGNDNSIGLFFGDVVEFNALEAMEYVIEPVYHRFNTQQRETSNEIYTTLQYDEIETDDYDVRFTEKCNSGFLGATFEKKMMNNNNERCRINQRPEGYYYLPHYKIQVRAFGDTLNQESASQLNVSSIINDGLPESYYQVTTKSLHYLNKNDFVMVSQLYNGVETNPLYCKVNEIKSLTTFVLICSIDIKNLTNIIIRKVNDSIPSYANNLKDGTGRYIWRNVYGVGKNIGVDLPEYSFTNGSFYIEKNINFFLKRQDPFNYAKLQAYEHEINDISGNNVNIDNYVYRQIEENVC